MASLARLGGQDFEAGAFENAAGGFAHERLVLYEKNGAPRRGGWFGADVALQRVMVVLLSRSVQFT